MRVFAPLEHLSVAFALLSRLPVPPVRAGAFDRQDRAVWAYPVVGLVVGLLAAGAGLLALRLGLAPGIAGLLAVTVQVVVTGAMHEDGLADTADGLWGGLTPERRLDIMRDSRIGTYGVLALILSVGIRVQALALLLPLGGTGVAALAVAAMTSRAIMPALMAALPHARKDGLARQVGRPGVAPVALGGGIALVAALVAFGPMGLGACLAALLAGAGLGLLARARLGGQTGDILGASQQIAEIAVLLTCLCLL
ncbi:MAG: adenosylcobinamide-GDP ribazoletransferase [Pseudomonadota bacterium]